MPSASVPVRRWRLRPGAPVLRRDTALLQVGLDPPSRALLDDTPGVRGLLDRLRTGCAGPGAGPGASTAWHRLHQALLLVPAPAPVTTPGSAPFEATAAWAGPGAVDRLTARRRARVRLLGPADLAAPVERLARLGGLRLDSGDPATPATDDPPLLVVVLHEGEARREQHDAAVAAGHAHLPVWWRSGVPHVGPLVVPGVTACLRCIDAHESEADPRRPLLLEQAGREPAPPRDPVLLALTTAWVVRDVQRWAEGDAPSSWSATVRLEPGDAPSVTAWARHPHCGCAWDEALGA